MMKKLNQKMLSELLVCAGGSSAAFAWEYGVSARVVAMAENMGPVPTTIMGWAPLVLAAMVPEKHARFAGSFYGGVMYQRLDNLGSALGLESTTAPPPEWLPRPM